MRVSDSDIQIFVTALNKMDNPRAKELMTDYILSEQFLADQSQAGELAEYKFQKNMSDKVIVTLKKQIDLARKVRDKIPFMYDGAEAEIIQSEKEITS